MNGYNSLYNQTYGTRCGLHYANKNKRRKRNSRAKNDQPTSIAAKTDGVILATFHIVKALLIVTFTMLALLITFIVSLFSELFKQL